MKKKGFTLIELLAVIVILAVIALIAVPIILNLIEQSRRKAAVSAALGYVRSVNYKIADEALFNREVDESIEYTIGENELAISANNIDDITGAYSLSDGKVLWAGLCVWNKYSVEYNKGYAEITGNNCAGSQPYEYDYSEEKTYQSLEDLCTGSSADSIYSNTTKYKAETVNDLVCLSNLVGSNKDFSGKEVYLIEDIDFNRDNSYSDSATTVYGDINGNGTTDGIKTEVTTNGGFKPIGNESKSFKGTFIGNSKTISNLMINRTTLYTGLFGNNAGTIKGLTIKGASVTGGKNSNNQSYAGILAGKNTGAIISVSVEGNVTAAGNYVGGIAGYLSRSGASNTYIRNVLYKGIVTGNSYVGGITGSADYSGSSGNPKMDFKGVVYDSTITATWQDTSRRINYTLGYMYNSTDLNRNVKYNNVSLVALGNPTGWNELEKNIPEVTLEAVDGALDTYIGGDNDNDGYYFDYDSDGNLRLYSLLERPLNYDDRTRKLKDLKGAGTEDNPYLISNAFDWRLASSTVKDAKYYSVEKDIDFANNNYYALGTNENKFKGNINGNMNTVSNISVYGHDYVGLFGYNTGTIEGLKFNNVTAIAASTNVGGIAGYNTGTIKGIQMRNISVSGGLPSISTTSKASNVGGIVGDNRGAIISVDVQGNITSTGENIGGIAGQLSRDGASNTYIRSALFKGTVTGFSYVAGIAGIGSYSGSTGNAKMDFKGVVYDSTIKATTTDTTHRWNYTLGYMYNSADLNKDLKYKNVSLIVPASAYGSTDEKLIPFMTLDSVDGALDTYIGGDNDGDGYYFDYDTSGNIVLYSTADTQIENTLIGDGTSNSPYKIHSAADWKMASALGNKNKYFVLEADLDFTNNKFYALGTKENRFNGNINGKMHTISNVTVGGHDYVGLFGYNTGTIEGFKFNNITVTAPSTIVGGIAGYNTGTIKGIQMRNISVSGGLPSISTTSKDSFTGGIVGDNRGAISSIDIEGNITSTGNDVGGIAGQLSRSGASNTYIRSVLFKGTVTGNNYVAGIAGIGSYASATGNAKMDFKGVVYDSTITATWQDTSRKLGRALGYMYNYTDLSINAKYKDTALVAIASSSSYPYSFETSISDLALSTVDGALDTSIGGDNDSDGYYFEDCSGSLTLLSTTLSPIGSSNACSASTIPVDTTDYEENVSNPTHGGIVYLDPQNPTRVCTKSDVDSNVNSDGKLTGVKTGCMRFYVIGEATLTYKLLLDHNTSGGVAFANKADYIEAGGNDADWDPYQGNTSMGPVTANKRLASDTTGWIGNPRLITTNELAEITGANTALSWDSSKTYTNPVTDMTTQVDSFHFDGSGNTYAGWKSQIANESNKSRYSWLYNNTTYCLQYGCRIEDNNEYAGGNGGMNTPHGYWTSDAQLINYGWGVSSGGGITSNDVTEATNFGVRPVITVSKTTVTVY